MLFSRLILVGKRTIGSILLPIKMAESNDEKAPVSGQGNLPLSSPAHALSYDQVINEIQTNRKQGLTDDEAKQRLETYGRNELDSGGEVQPVKILIRQIANAMILVMLTIPICAPRMAVTDPITTRSSSWPWLLVLASNPGLKEVSLPQS